MDNFKVVLDTEGRVLIDHNESGREIYYLYNGTDKTIVQSPRFLKLCREIQEAETECETPKQNDGTNDPQTSGGMTQLGIIVITSSSDSDSDESVDLRRGKMMKRKNEGNVQLGNKGKKRRWIGPVTSLTSSPRNSVAWSAQPSTSSAHPSRLPARPPASRTTASISKVKPIHPALDSSTPKAGTNHTLEKVSRPLIQSPTGTAATGLRAKESSEARQPSTSAASPSVASRAQPSTSSAHPSRLPARPPASRTIASIPKVRPIHPALDSSTPKAGASHTRGKASRPFSRGRAGANHAQATAAARAELGPVAEGVPRAEEGPEARQPSLIELYRETVELRITLVLNRERERLIELMNLVSDYFEFKRLQDLEHE
ncbi:uncharacterized protein LOC107037452 [Diachasma alloeum]|uniref:uncharacterized protein LOC107037452 n=1 Tax=Diachasma alloeum TaxID=454923 RepID=UPI0007381350|nr:uncharacterized protein LOC107037452 [Diachasma alloeum]